MIYDILTIFICMFAAYGMTEIFLYFFEHHCSKKIHSDFYILASNLSDEKCTEHAIRILEGLLCRDGCSHIIKGILLDENVVIGEDTLDSLCNEFGNIYKKEELRQIKTAP